MSKTSNGKPPELPNDQPPAADPAVTELDGAALDDRKRQHIADIKVAEAGCLELLVYLQPNGQPTRELSIAKTKIEEAAMWAIKGVVTQ